MIFRDDLTDEIEVELIDYGVAQSLQSLKGIVGGDQYLKSPHHFGTKGTLQIISYKPNQIVAVYSIFDFCIHR